MIDREKLSKQFNQEWKRFEELHPTSKILFEKAKNNLLQGVPLNWMVRWMGGYPIFVESAKGAHIHCVDGIDYVDFCLGDTGALSGHASEVIAEEMQAQYRKGATFMLPTDDAIWNGEELERRFGMKYWQFTTSATDANRFALRLARRLTGRSKILVFNYCYHGTVDETIASIASDGKIVARRGNIGYPVDPSLTTKIVEWNDIEGLELALQDHDVAAVLAEPVMTNIGVVLPDPGFHDIMRKLTQKYGTLLIIDETHTMCAGPGGYGKDHGLDPDMVTIGKFIAAGIPAGAFGLHQRIAQQAEREFVSEFGYAKGIGGTLAANALTMRVMRVTLSKVLNEEFYHRNIPLAAKFNEGVERVIAEFGLSWKTTQLGCRTEYLFQDKLSKNGIEAMAAKDNDLDWYMHLACLNRGVIMTPFHNMALITSATSQSDIDRHTTVFREVVYNIIS